MTFHIVESVLNSQVGLFIIGMSLTVPPVLGIMAVHQKNDSYKYLVDKVILPK